MVEQHCCVCVCVLQGGGANKVPFKCNAQEEGLRSEMTASTAIVCTCLLIIVTRNKDISMVTSGGSCWVGNHLDVLSLGSSLLKGWGVWWLAPRLYKNSISFYWIDK